MRFLNLPKDLAKKDSFFSVLPIVYEKSPTYLSGAKKGSGEIIKASLNLEYYDEQFNIEPFEGGVFTFNSLKPKNIEQISKFVSDVKNKFLISLGGDHAVTIGLVKGFEKKFSDFSVLVFDAHSDFRHSWNNSTENHACVNKRLSVNHKIGIVGLRSQDVDEAKEISSSDNVFVLKAYDYNKESFIELLKKLNNNIYLSIDVDVFDSSFIRNTGTPEPGGFFWNQFINMLKTVFASKNVIAADIVEFCPRANFESESFALAKLCYKLMALKIKSSL